MKRCLAPIALALLLGVTATRGQTTGKDVSQRAAKVEAEIRRLETVRFEAMVKMDVAALERILADDLTYTHSSGQLDTKTQFIDSLKSGALHYEAITPDETKVRVTGDAAVVTGHGVMKIRAGNQSQSLRLRFTDVYLRRRGRWQMVAWQSTRLPEK